MKRMASLSGDMLYEAEIRRLQEQVEAQQAEILRLRAHIETLMEKKARGRRPGGQDGDCDTDGEREIGLARTDDPETSHLAGNKIKSKVGAIQQEVLLVLKDAYPNALHDNQINEAANKRFGPRGPSTWRTRRKELVRMGRVKWTGERIRDEGRGPFMTWIWRPESEEDEE